MLVAIVLAVVALTVGGFAVFGGGGSGGAAATTTTTGASTITTTPTITPSGAAARKDFLQAWERSLRGTWHVVSSFERAGKGATAPLQGQLDTVQRPPDRLERQFGSVTGRVGGRLVGCTPGPDGQPRCRDGGPAASYDEDVQAELDRLDPYVGGDHPLYRVTAEGNGCFRLDREFEYLAPPYGDQARFCFDAATGARVLTEVHLAEATDITRAVTVVATVTDSDLTLPAALAG